MSSAPRRIGVLVALREELRAIEPALRSLGASVGRTGIGKAGAFTKGSEFIERVRPEVIVACGFGGGLRDDLRSGDMLVASEVVEEGSEGRRWSAPADLLAAAEAAGRIRALTKGKVLTGRLVTVAQVLSSVEAKRRVRDTLGADAVDMESSGVLEAASRRGVPVLCVRAILDEHDFELPFDFGKILTPAGRPRILRAVGAVAANPAGLAKLLQLRERARAAARSLAELIPSMVEALS